MKVSELRTQSIAELHKMLAEKRVEMVEKRRSNAAGELANPRSIKEIRRDIALILTVANEQKTTAAKEEANG